MAFTFLLFLTAAVFQLAAQQNEGDRKLLEDICAKAEVGDAQSQYALGDVFYDGSLGVAKDQAEAVKWYRNAAEKNHAQAQFKLAVCYINGLGVARGVAEAVKWYRKAAEQNYALAQYSLGWCYAQGHGVAQDYVEAVKWLRKAADQGSAKAQYELGGSYARGQGVATDDAEAVKWLRKAAEQNYALGQYYLGVCYSTGRVVGRDYVEAVKWYRKAAEQNLAEAQYNLGYYYNEGLGTATDYVEADKWYRKAAEQGYAAAQYNLGNRYYRGEGVAKDYVEADKWWLLASAQGNESGKKGVTFLERLMTREQLAEAQKLSRNFTPREARIAEARPQSSCTGFFITEDGYLITKEHVTRTTAQVGLVTIAGFISAKMVKVDVADDLALLKAEGRFAALPIAAGRTVKLGSTVATVGFPNIGLQGFAPKLAKGEIVSLSGARDDARSFQISVPVQPGNSGGALVDDHGNVVGVVSAKLDIAAALAASGTLPENVNYAVKSSYLLSFLEAVPEVSAKLKEPNTKERKFEDVVRDAEQAAVLVLVY
jgi:TPR repeat protein